MNIEIAWREILITERHSFWWLIKTIKSAIHWFNEIDVTVDYMI